MDIDDPRLVEARERSAARIAKFDERMLTVMKNHLGLEHALNEVLSASARKWKGKKCAGKIAIAKDELDLPEIDEKTWAVMEAANTLRNAVAHGKAESTIAARLADLRKAYLDALTPEQAKGSENLTDVQLVMMAFTHGASYLMIASVRVKEDREARGET